MAGVVRKKQDDKHLKTLREIVSQGGNKQCFDCGQRGPTYVNMTIGAFVCTRCSGLLRGVMPPHRVKSISMATFSAEEIEFIRSHGNDACAKTWLGLWDPKRVLQQDQRDLMADKYERKRYFLEPASPLKSLPQHTNSINNNHSTIINHNHHNGNLINGLTGSSSSGTSTPAVALTPPASLRLAAPAATNAANGSRSTATRNGHSTHHQFQTQFTPDDQPFGAPTAKAALNGNATSAAPSSAAIRHSMNGLSGGQTATSNGDRSRLNGPPPNGQKFTPDGDFGLDFGGGFAERRSGDANADFADFEHNTIFNSAGLPMSISSTSGGGSLNSSGSTPFNSSSSSINSTPPVDRYAALKDLDMQLREVVNETTPGGGLFANGSAANGNGTASTNGHETANPFMAATAASNGPATVNPFQANGPGQNINNNGTAPGLNWTTDFGGASTQSAFVPQLPQQPKMFAGTMSNGFGNGFGNGGFHPMMTGGNNNNNMPGQQSNGFGMMQRNPFAATATGGGSIARSNNPFL